MNVFRRCDFTYFTQLGDECFSPSCFHLARRSLGDCAQRLIGLVRMPVVTVEPGQCQRQLVEDFGLLSARSVTRIFVGDEVDEDFPRSTEVRRAARSGMPSRRFLRFRIGLWILGLSLTHRRNKGSGGGTGPGSHSEGVFQPSEPGNVCPPFRLILHRSHANSFDSAAAVVAPRTKKFICIFRPLFSLKEDLLESPLTSISEHPYHLCMFTFHQSMVIIRDKVRLPRFPQTI